MRRHYWRDGNVPATNSKELSPALISSCISLRGANGEKKTPISVLIKREIKITAILEENRCVKSVCNRSPSLFAHSICRRQIPD